MFELELRLALFLKDYCRAMPDSASYILVLITRNYVRQAVSDSPLKSHAELSPTNQLKV